MAVPLEVQKYLKEVEPITIAQEIKLKSVGVLSGSKVFGGMRKDSDIDLILPPSFSLMKLWDCWTICYAGNYSHEEFLSFYVKTADRKRVYNLLHMQYQESFDKYVWATEQMIKDPRDFTDKKTRVKAFRRYKNIWMENK